MDNASSGSGYAFGYNERPSVGDRPVTGDEMVTVGTINYSTGIAIGRDSWSSVNINGANENVDAFGVFPLINKVITARPEDEKVSKKDIRSAIFAIETEIGRGYAARRYRILDALDFLLNNAPDVADPILILLSSPSLSIDEEIRRSAEKLARERGIVGDINGDWQKLIEKIAKSKLEVSDQQRAKDILTELMKMVEQDEIPHDLIPPLLSELQRILSPELRLDVMCWMTNSNKVPTAVKIMGRSLLV